MLGFAIGVAVCLVAYFLAGIFVLIWTRQETSPQNAMECLAVVLLWPFFALMEMGGD